MPQRILGIDLGAWSVKAVLIETGFRGFEVVDVREARVRTGETDDKLDRQVEALQELLLDGKMRADAYVAGFPGEAATMRFIHMPFQDQKRVEATLGGELEDVVPFDLGSAVYDHTIVRKLADGGSTTLAAIAPKDAVQKFIAALHHAGTDPKFVPIDSLQLFNLYSYFLREDLSKAEAPTAASTDAGTFIAASPDGPPDARLVVDIGHERTLVLAAGENGPAYMRAIRAGGRDVTEAIAKAYSISFDDAEGGKHADALVTSSRHPAPSDAAQKMSDVCTQGLDVLVKELRRALQAIRTEKRVRIARIDLLGGGARIKNLANYLAEQLNVPVANGVAVEQAVEKHLEAPRRPAYALALAYALRTTGDEKVSAIDLRIGDLQFAGQLRHLKDKVPLLGAAAAGLLLLFGVNVFAQYHVVSAREEAIDLQFCEITKKTLGKEVCEPTVAVSMMRSPTSELGSFKLPERSAFKIAADISNLIPPPPAPDVLVSELEVTPERVRVTGETVSFDAVDSIVTEYAKEPCFEEIKKSKLRKTTDGKAVEFQISIKLRCS
jgi:general secretion pathway protein L